MSKTAWPSPRRRRTSTESRLDPTTVRRQSGTNTVQVVDAVKERLEEVEPLAPPGYAATFASRAILSEFIRASIESVEDTSVVGSILAAAVVLVFLGTGARR